MGGRATFCSLVFLEPSWFRCTFCRHTLGDGCVHSHVIGIRSSAINRWAPEIAFAAFYGQAPSSQSKEVQHYMVVFLYSYHISAEKDSTADASAALLGTQPTSTRCAPPGMPLRRVAIYKSVSRSCSVATLGYLFGKSEQT